MSACSPSHCASWTMAPASVNSACTTCIEICQQCHIDSKERELGQFAGLVRFSPLLLRLPLHPMNRQAPDIRRHGHLDPHERREVEEQRL